MFDLDYRGLDVQPSSQVSGTAALLGLAAVILSEPNDVSLASEEVSDFVEPLNDVDEKLPMPIQVEDSPRSPKPLIDPESNCGMISGRIVVSTRVIGKISSYMIVVQEDFNTNGRKESDPLPFFKK